MEINSWSVNSRANTAKITGHLNALL